MRTKEEIMKLPGVADKKCVFIHYDVVINYYFNWRYPFIHKIVRHIDSPSGKFWRITHLSGRMQYGKN